jgi:glycosyltransferase involved in cell wall biosynthesis
MKISIAVPSYNYAQFLDACLNSIMMQDYKNFEVLIADGGSTDGSLNIIKRFCEQDHRFRLVSVEDSGQPDAVVKAFTKACGDIMCFLNADDFYLCEDALSAVVAAYKAYPNIDIVSYGGYYVDSAGHLIKPIHYRYHPLDSIALMKYRTAVLQPATFWRRQVQEVYHIRTDFHYSFDSVFFYEAYRSFVWLELSKPIAGYRLQSNNKSLRIIPERIYELARFEQLKFGSMSLRALYLYQVGFLVKMFGRIPVIGTSFCRCIRVIINSLSFITCYRLPGI